MRTILSPALAALLLAMPAAASSEDQQLPAYRASSNLELVAHIPMNGGTDLEFFSRTLDEYKAPNGEMVPVDPPVERHFAFVGNQTVGPRIVDITDPENPYVAATIPNCTVGQGDPQVNKEGTIAVVARQTSGTCRLADGRTVSNGSIIIDMEDPYTPTPVGHAPEGSGSHNNTLHPNGKHLYISTSNIAAANGRTPIFDISDPAAPRKVRDWTTPGNAPHDVRFSDDGTRAYFAGISQYRIVNTEDPENPELISVMVPPGGTIGHDTLVTPDKAFLFLGDEAGGGGTYPCPGGAVYLYDIRDEENPVLVGMAEAGGGPVVARAYDEVPGPTTIGGCTSHVMELNPDGKSFTLGWYRLGSRVFSFANLYERDGTPKDLAAGGSWGDNGLGLVETGWIVPQGFNTWSAKQYHKVPGYIFSDDLVGGFYVTRIRETAPPRPTAVTALSADSDGSTVAVSGSAAFGGQPRITVATDPEGDGPPGSGPLGIDTTALQIRVPDPGKPEVEFIIRVTELNHQPPNEVIRYLWQITINGVQYWVSAKRSDITTPTANIDDPEESHTRVLKNIRLRGNCQTIENVATCGHLGWLDGEFDPHLNEIRARVPVGASFAPHFVPGNTIPAGGTMTASVQAFASNAQTSDTVTLSQDYTIPAPTVQLGVAPAGTAPGSVSYAYSASVAGDWSFSGAVPASAVGEDDVIYARACFGGNCGFATVGA